MSLHRHCVNPNGSPSLIRKDGPLFEGTSAHLCEQIWIEMGRQVETRIDSRLGANGHYGRDSFEMGLAGPNFVKCREIYVAINNKTRPS